MSAPHPAPETSHADSIGALESLVNAETFEQSLFSGVSAALATLALSWLTVSDPSFENHAVRSGLTIGLAVGAARSGLRWRMLRRERISLLAALRAGGAS